MFGELPGLISGSLFLLLFAVGYNWLVDWAITQGYGDKYMAYFVVGGVLMVSLTAGFVGVVNWEQVVLFIVMFAAAGIPMAIGEAVRATRRENEQRDRMAKLMGKGPDGDAD